MYLYAFLMIAVRCIVVEEKIYCHMWDNRRTSFDKLTVEWASRGEDVVQECLKAETKTVLVASRNICTVRPSIKMPS
jgi:hypothetical protein